MRAGGRGDHRPAKLDRGDLPGLLPDSGGGHQRPVRVGRRRGRAPPRVPVAGAGCSAISPAATSRATVSAANPLGIPISRARRPRHAGVVVDRAQHCGLRGRPRVVMSLIIPGR